MTILAVITARGGSKALPGKNIAPLAGKPLIAWSIEAALHSQVVTRTVVSTDDAEIAAVSRRYGADVPFLRPAELATDEATSVAVVLHAVRWLANSESYAPDVVVHLQPTSPLRVSQDIDRAVALLEERGADAVVGLVEAKHHPYWMKTIDDAGWMHDFVRQPAPTTRRQDLAPVYAINGAIYLARREALLTNKGWYGARTAGYIMPRERSIDIDTVHDLALAARVLENTDV